MRVWIWILSFVIAAVSATPSLAQSGDDAAKRERERKERQRALYGADLGRYVAPADGPCPTVKVLWDASRYVEMNGPDSVKNVGFTAEFQEVDSQCTYQDDEPIVVSIRPIFSFGRGPQADGLRKQYAYFVAVTRKDTAVIDKVWMPMNVEFQPDQVRLTLSDEMNGIVIPRANEEISGSNFEILLGFELTPEQLAYNRSGKRFRVNAGTGQE